MLSENWTTPSWMEEGSGWWKRRGVSAEAAAETTREERVEEAKATGAEVEAWMTGEAMTHTGGTDPGLQKKRAEASRLIVQEYPEDESKDICNT